MDIILANHSLLESIVERDVEPPFSSQEMFQTTSKEIAKLVCVGLAAVIDRATRLGILSDLAVKYICDERPLFQLSMRIGSSSPFDCKSCDWKLLHAEKRDSAWTVREMTQLLLSLEPLLLQLGMRSERQHNIWCDVLNPIEASPHRHEFPRYAAFEKAHDDDGDICIQPFVEPEEVAKLYTRTKDLLEVFAAGMKQRNKEFRVGKTDCWEF
jgi:hypothetical protein